MSRLKLWGMLFTCSLVSMFSILSTLPNRKSDEKWERYERWIMSVTCISICLSFIGGLVSCLPPQQSLKLENPIITLCLIFWSAGLPAIMDPDKSLAVTVGGGIANANLYFFSWGSLICCILLAGAWAAQYNGDEASATATQWCCLAASSFILMGTSSATYNDLNCRKDDTDESTQVCNRNLFAIILGIVSGFMGLIMLPMKNAPAACQGLIGLLLLVSWACGVAYITFNNGPGSNLGNVYFSTWISLFICIHITTTCINLLLGEYFNGNDGDQKEQQQEQGENDNDNNNKEDLPEEEEQPPEVDDNKESGVGVAAAATDDNNALKASV